MEKKFMPAYQPARLVRGRTRWYILVYSPEVPGGPPKRYRPTFKLNRIKDLRARETRAQELLDKINLWLRCGLLFREFREDLPLQVSLVTAGNEPQQPDKPKLMEALKTAMKIKSQDIRLDTLRTYESALRIFGRWVAKRKYAHLHVDEFTQSMAYEFMDHRRLSDKIGPETYNNNIREMRALFTELVRREQVPVNPFSRIPLRKKEKKERRALNQEEARVVANAIRKKRPILFYALLLQYACFIRPGELRRLRFWNVQPGGGIVVVNQDQAKTKKDRTVTIPDDFLPFFREPFWSEWPGDWLIFGEHFKPHPEKPCGERTMNSIHRRMLKKLAKEGQLRSIKGLSWYSWKDTGITDALAEIEPLAVKDQAGHRDLQMTMRYRHQKPVNTKMKGFRNRLTDEK